jgi:membrane protease YdiL (CAAX protease family)
VSETPQPARQGVIDRLKASPRLAALLAFVWGTAVFAANGYLLARFLRGSHVPPAVGDWLQLPAELIVLSGLVWLVSVTRSWRESGAGAKKMRAASVWGYAAVPFALLAYSVGRESLADPLHLGTAWTLLPASRIIATLIVTLAIAVTEELYFRGILFRGLATYGIGLAVVGSAVVFALAHASNALAGQAPALTLEQVVQTLLIGMLYAGLRLRTGSLGPVIVIHCAVDFLSAMTGLSPSAMLPAPPTLWPVPPMLIVVALYGIWLVSEEQRAGRASKLPV